MATVRLFNVITERHHMHIANNRKAIVIVIAALIFATSLAAAAVAKIHAAHADIAAIDNERSVKTVTITAKRMTLAEKERYDLEESRMVQSGAPEQTH